MWCVHRELKYHPRIFFLRPRTVLTIDAQRDERAMAVWADNVDTIIPLVREFEEKLIKLVWKNTLA